jgi:hypothetical protein
MANEAQICKDWIREFPRLARFKHGRKLLRIQNPVVFGIELEKFFNHAYRPKFVALNLLSSFPEFAIGRTLATTRSPQFSVPYSKHESTFQEGVGLMREAFPFLAGDGVLSEEILIDIYRSEIKAILGESASPLAVWFSLIQLLKFFGRDAEVPAERVRLADHVKALSPSSLAVFGDFDDFLKRELDVAPEEFEKRRRANVAKGNWNVLPGV